VIRVSPRSTPDARKGYQRQVLSPKFLVVVVIIVVVVVVDSGRVRSRLVPGRRRWRRRSCRRIGRRNQERRLLQQWALRHKMAVLFAQLARIHRLWAWRCLGFT
jgi:hypothetical protein